MFVLNKDNELVRLYGSTHGDDHCMVYDPSPSIQKIIKNVMEGTESDIRTNNSIIIQKVYNKRSERKPEPTFFRRKTKPPTNLELSTMCSRIKIKRKLKGARK